MKNTRLVSRKKNSTKKGGREKIDRHRNLADRQEMLFWRRTVDPLWLSAREGILQALGQGGLAIIARPGHKRLQLEIACRSQADSRRLVKEFGGKAEKVSRDWRRQLAGQGESKPFKVGRRLIIARSIRGLRRCSVCCPQRISSRRSRPGAPRTAHTTARVGKPPFLVIPASTAFGTGEHPTTAMSLRFLEQVTRRLRSGWSLVDLGTGSGILALAAKCFGAKRVVAIDVDPTAISTAKTNAALNNIDDVDFQVGDLRRWKPAGKIDIITANLFSELLIQLLPKLRRSNWLILSGVLRAQEREFLGALRRKRINVVEVRRRGKWIAVFAKSI